MRVTDFHCQTEQDSPDFVRLDVNHLRADVLDERESVILILCVRKMDDENWNAIIRNQLGGFISRGADSKTYKEAIAETRKIAVKYFQRLSSEIRAKPLY